VYVAAGVWKGDIVRYVRLSRVRKSTATLGNPGENADSS